MKLTPDTKGVIDSMSLYELLRSVMLSDSLDWEQGWLEGETGEYKLQRLAMLREQDEAAYTAAAESIRWPVHIQEKEVKALFSWFQRSDPQLGTPEERETVQKLLNYFARRPRFVRKKLSRFTRQQRLEDQIDLYSES